MYISGEGPNLLLHIALIKQWKASGQTDGRAKNWDFAKKKKKSVQTYFLFSSDSSHFIWSSACPRSQSAVTSPGVVWRFIRNNWMCGEPRPLSLKLVQPQKGGHFILRRYMWDLGAPWSDFCLWKKVMKSSQFITSTQYPRTELKRFNRKNQNSLWCHRRGCNRNIEHLRSKGFGPAQR